MLQGDEDYRREGDNPQQSIAELRAGCEVACPVAGVYEAHGNEKSRSDILQDIESAENVLVVLAPQFLENVHHLTSLKTEIQTLHAVGEGTDADEVHSLLGIIADGVVGNAA